MRKFLLSVLLPVLAGIANLSAQNHAERTDSLVRLMSARQMELIERDGDSFRKVTGPARFLHNNTYLICDTAYWHVEMQRIEAIGNVKILQEETVLTSDNLTYFIDRDLAEFRGTLVQLEDKDHNMLRTRHMDYNTRDSVAVFQHGGSMKDKDGQVIESRTGTYDSKIKLFTFTDDVNMFTDSIFVKTTRLTYDTRRSYATFGFGTDAWKEDDMLSSDAGWYDRNRELFFFRNKVHGMTDDQEVWTDSLYFWRLTSDVEMAGHAQLTDTTRNVFALAGHMHYIDSLARITLTRDPAVVGLTGETGTAADTVWFGADRMVYETLPMCDIAEETVRAAQKRLEDLAQDAVMTYRRKAAEEAEKARQEAMQDDPNNPDAARQRAAQAAAGEPSLPEQGPPGASGAEEPPAEPETPPSAPPGEPATAETPDPEQAPESEVPPPGTAEEPEDSGLDPAFAVPDSLSAGRHLSVATDTLVRPDTLAAGADRLASGRGRLIPGRGRLASARDSLAFETDTLASGRDSLTFGTDSLASGRDSLAFAADSLVFSADSLTAPADSVDLGPRDSTKVGFLTALGRVRLYREDIQIVADSLSYNDLDSLVRLYKDPIVWNETNRQYSSDSLYAVIKDRRMQKANLLSNAFIIIEEEKDLCYDQIRGAEMLAYFDSTGALRRFDALGDASAIFYLKEDSTFATVNLSQAKMLYAQFVDGEIDRVSYFDQIKNNAYPLAQLSSDERRMKGFNWQPDRRPAGKEDITPLTLRPSERSAYAARPRAAFTQTDIYYPDYMSGVYKRLREAEAEKARRRREQAEREQTLRDSLLRADSAAWADSLSVPDSLALRDSLAAADSLSLKDSLAVSDSLSAATDSLKTAADSLASLDPKALKKAEREAAAKARAEERALKQVAKEQRWAELDSLDAARDRLKAEKKAAKLRQQKIKALQAAERQAEKDRKKLEKYLRRYEKKKAREDERRRRKQQKDSGLPIQPLPALSRDNKEAALPEKGTAAIRNRDDGEEPGIPVTP